MFDVKINTFVLGIWLHIFLIYHFPKWLLVKKPNDDLLNVLSTNQRCELQAQFLLYTQMAVMKHSFPNIAHNFSHSFPEDLPFVFTRNTVLFRILKSIALLNTRAHHVMIFPLVLGQGKHWFRRGWGAAARSKKKRGCSIVCLFFSVTVQ